MDSDRRGKERFYRPPPEGKRVCDADSDLRKSCLVDTYLTVDHDADALRHMADLLRCLSGFYDQAARAAPSV